MSKILKIKNKNLFVKSFLTPITKISDACVFELSENSIYCLASTADNSVFISASFPIETESIETAILNCSDVKKLIKAIDTISVDEISFTLEENNLSYKDKNIRFKYHLLEDGIIKKPKMNLKKLSETPFESTFTLQSDQIKELIRGSVFSSDSNKVYIYSDDDGVHAELTDKTRNNIDTITLKLCDNYSGEIIQNMPLNFEIFRMMDISSSKDVFVKINGKIGVVLFELENNYNKTKYIVSSLVK